MKSIDRTAVERFYQARYRPAGATLILVGDVARVRGSGAGAAAARRLVRQRGARERR